LSIGTTAAEMPGTVVSAFVTAKFCRCGTLSMIMMFRRTASPFGSKFPKLIIPGVTVTVGLM
jgi:hypothetical protein